MAAISRKPKLSRLAATDLHLGPRASGKRYSGILGHTGHTYSGIIFGFGFWGFGIWGDLGELIFGGRPDYSWHRFGGSSWLDLTHGKFAVGPMTNDCLRVAMILYLLNEEGGLAACCWPGKTNWISLYFLGGLYLLDTLSDSCHSTSSIWEHKGHRRGDGIIMGNQFKYTHLGPNIISSISHSFLGLVLRFHRN